MRVRVREKARGKLGENKARVDVGQIGKRRRKGKQVRLEGEEEEEGVGVRKGRWEWEDVNASRLMSAGTFSLLKEPINPL